MDLKKCCGVEPKTYYINFGNQTGIIINCRICNKKTDLKLYDDQQETRVEAEREWNKLVSTPKISEKRIKRAIGILNQYADESHKLLKSDIPIKKDDIRKDNIAFNDAIDVLKNYLADAN